MKQEAITVTGVTMRLIYEYFMVCPSYYYSITYIVNLLLLFWMYDRGCSPHHASFHVHVYFVIRSNKDILTDWLMPVILYLLISSLARSSC